MKKLLYAIIMLPLLFVACNNELSDSNNEFADMSTTDLLETLIEERIPVEPWCLTCSSFDISGVTRFNDNLRIDKMAIELFARRDCFPVLTSKYRAFMEEKQEISFPLVYFEMLLASDLCMSVLNESQKIQLLEMALEKTAYDTEPVNEACHIMIAVMQSFHYTPFVEEVVPKLHETVCGYTLSALDDHLIGRGFELQGADVIIEYATQFLNEQ
jgi:hypothetical protein